MDTRPESDGIKHFFEPHSVAIVGASRSVDKAGHVIFKNFVDNKRRGIFKGDLYPVNPTETEILSYKSYRKVSHVPSGVDLVVIVVPAAVIPQIVEECGQKGVKAVVIVSAGFAEIGNNALQDEVKQIADKYGIRILGPNCLGVYDADSGVDMLFMPETKVLLTGEEVVATPRPMHGYLSLVSQSGAFGISALDYMAGHELGVCKFVSFGNKIDVDEPEILNYLGKDKCTRVILLYVESIERGRAFMDAALQVSTKKPIVSFKAARTVSGATAAKSHTAALAGSDEIYDAAFKQSGVVRARNMEEFFDIAKALSLQPPAQGRSIAILTDAGGPGIMAVDECELRGLKVETFQPPTLAKFDELKRQGRLRSFASCNNPVDLTGSVESPMFEDAARILLDAPEVMGLVAIVLHHVPALHEDVVDRVAAVASGSSKPLTSCDIGQTEMARIVRQRFEKFGIPSYPSPERAVSAMEGLVKYGEFLWKHDAMTAYISNFEKTRKGQRSS